MQRLRYKIKFRLELNGKHCYQTAQRSIKLADYEQSRDTDYQAFIRFHGIQFKKKINMLICGMTILLLLQPIEPRPFQRGI
jgi:hypothetical protein